MYFSSTCVLGFRTNRWIGGLVKPSHLVFFRLQQQHVVVLLHNRKEVTIRTSKYGNEESSTVLHKPAAGPSDSLNVSKEKKDAAPRASLPK
jgi:hypothetical protein